MEPKLATSLNPSDCAETEFDSSRYLKKILPENPHFGLEFQTKLSLGE